VASLYSAPKAVLVVRITSRAVSIAVDGEVAVPSSFNLAVIAGPATASGAVRHVDWYGNLSSVHCAGVGEVEVEPVNVYDILGIGTGRV
jgi:hypothetical protein